MSVTCDYLVLGAGVQGLAFTDALLNTIPSAKVAIVDRRSSPGGMWNDIYPFARLDQPNIFYAFSHAVRLEGAGPKSGGEPSGRASRAEVLLYFRKIMQHLVKNCSVRFLPSYSADITKAGLPETQVRLTSTVIANRTIDVTVRNKVVDAGGCESVPVHPASRPFPFEVEDGVKIVRPHSLALPGTAHRSLYVVIGAGKTGIDTVVWLLSRQVPPEKVCWVVSRDSWYFVAEGMEQETYYRTCMKFNTVLATAESSKDVYIKSEKHGTLCRFDRTRTPELFHCLQMSKADLVSLRKVPKIHLGRVQKVAADRLFLEHGTTEIPAGALYVDCTGNGPDRVQQVVPVFTESTIKLQRVVEFSVAIAAEMNVPFCAAALGQLEAMYPGSAHTKNCLCTPAPFPDHYNDWIKYHFIRRKQDVLQRDDRRLSIFLMSHPCSPFYRMPAEQMRLVTASHSQSWAAPANFERIAPDVEFSRLLKGKPDAPAHNNRPASGGAGADGAGCKRGASPTKVPLAPLPAEQDQPTMHVRSAEAEDHSPKQPTMVTEAKQQRPEPYQTFLEGEEHPAHRLLEELSDHSQAGQVGNPVSTL